MCAENCNDELEQGCCMEQLTAEDIALSAMMAVNFAELDACKQAAAKRNPWINHPPNTNRVVLLQDVLWAAESRLWKTAR